MWIRSTIGLIWVEAEYTEQGILVPKYNFLNGSRPLTEFENKILEKTIKQTIKTKPTLKNRK